QDIDILTLAGHPIDHDNGIDDVASGIPDLPKLQVPNSSTSSSSLRTPDSEPQAPLFRRTSPHYPPQMLPNDATWPRHEHHFAPLGTVQTASTSSNVSDMIRILSAPPIVLEPDADTTSHLRPAARHPYCVGALAAQKDFGASFTPQYLPDLPGSDKLHRCL